MSPRPERTAPKHWKQDESGLLAAAVRAYIDDPVSLTMRHVALLRVYFRQWANSPVWEGDEIDKLRTDVDRIASPEAVAAWLRAARAMGIDPL